jgi:UDP-glucose 4-epimerase
MISPLMADGVPKSSIRRALVTGGAGFIGSNLADRLAAEGTEVVVLDNLSTGRREFISQLLDRNNATFVQADVLDAAKLRAALDGCDTVFHLAANADVRYGLEHPRLDLEQNTLAVSGVLEAMRAVGVRRIVFSSTGSVYGEPDVFPTPETCPFPTQTSLYGTSKLAAEGLIGAYCHGLDFTGVIFRFVSILGERYTHGHVYDFYRALRNDPARLRVLGDGRQEKSYLYVGDCVQGILTGLASQSGPGCSIFNLGTDETVIVNDSIAEIARHMGVKPELEYTGGRRGWPGDSPLILLDCARLRQLGWRPAVSIKEGIGRTLDWLDQNPFVFADREADVIGAPG